MYAKNQEQKIPLNILLADDDKDDRFFFAKALKELDIPTKLVTVGDGERLIDYLKENSSKLPDLLFLDLNMPRKNGSECLKEIKENKKLSQFPVIIYSTSLNETLADVLYDQGACYYMKKNGFNSLIDHLRVILTALVEKKMVRPPRNKFIIGTKIVKA